MPPCIPTRARRTTPVQLDLRYGWIVALDHFEKAFRLGRMLAPRRYDQRVQLLALFWAWDLAARADQKQFVLLAAPIAGAKLVLSPSVMAFLIKAPCRHFRQRMRQHRNRRPQEQDAILRRDRRPITIFDCRQNRCRAMVGSGAIHAGFV